MAEVEERIMPDDIGNLESFLIEMADLLRLVSTCSPVLFRAGFRQNLRQSVQEASSWLEGFVKDDFVQNPEEHDEMRRAGLCEPQLQLKLESFENASRTFKSEGGEDNLEKALDTGAIILGSLAGAIPGFGSFAQELVDFILKELKKRFWWRR